MRMKRTQRWTGAVALLAAATAWLSAAHAQPPAGSAPQPAGSAQPPAASAPQPAGPDANGSDAPVAGPEQAGPITPEASQKSDDLFKKGKQLYKDGKVKEAYQAYKEAWDLKRSYDLAANLANTELLIGMPRDAAEHYAYCLRTFAATGGKERRDAAQKKFDEARKEVGAVVVRVNVAGAEVLIDGKSVGRAPLKDEVYVDPGTRTVEAKIAGYEPAKQTVTAEKGKATEVVTLTLKANKPEVIIKKVTGPAGPQQPPPPPPKNVPLIATGAAVSGVVLGIAVGLGLTAQGKGKDADETLVKVHESGTPCKSPPQAGLCQDLLAARQQHDRLYRAFVGLTVTGAALAVATVAYAVWPASKPSAPKRDRAASVSLSPVIGPGIGGAVLSGAF